MKAGPFRAVVLIGPRGAGKSRLLPRVARGLGLRAIDTDAALEVEAGEAVGSLLRRVGEARFRELEASVAGSALRERRAAVALGGGAPTIPSVAEALGAPDLFVVLLLAPWPVLASRIAGSPTDRPPLLGPTPESEVQALLAKRLPLYRSLADLEVDTSVDTEEQCARKIVGALRSRLLAD
ncbi:MAG: shikimate kinase [Planctomycetota bacterium]